VGQAQRSDVELLTRIGAGNVEAFEALYGRYGRLAFALGFRLLRDPSEAEEVAQDAFLRVWRRAVRFDPARGTPVTWLLTITHRLAVDRLRRRRWRAVPDSPEVEAAVATAGDDPGDRAVDRVIGSQVRRALLNLAPEQRRALWLTYVAGYTQREAADVLAVPLGTVKGRVRLGLEHLRRVWLEARSPPSG